MIESPMLQQFVADRERKAVLRARRRDILDILLARFGTVTESMETELGTIDEEERLTELVKLAASCTDVESFSGHLKS